jgi:hypothetical protein
MNGASSKAPAGSSPRVVAVSRPVPTTQDSGLPVAIGMAAYIVAMPIAALAACLVSVLFIV